jgi:hypothetical protein
LGAEAFGEHFVQEQTEASSSRKIDSGCSKIGTSGGSEIQRQLLEIAMLLKVVIFGIGRLVCLLFVVVWKQ